MNLMEYVTIWEVQKNINNLNAMSFIQELNTIYKEYCLKKVNIGNTKLDACNIRK